MSSKVEALTEWDNRLWSVEQMLEDALEDVREASERYHYGMVLLADKDGLVEPRWWAANARVSQMVAMAEAHKFRLLSRFK